MPLVDAPLDAVRSRPLEVYRALYPVTRKKIWLNHASMGTLSDPVAEALRSYIDDHANGNISIPSDIELVAKAREAAAAFINADVEEIAFTKNVADALNIVAQGLAWRPGDRIVIADQEFPANVFPWTNLKSRGVEIVTVASVKGRVPQDAVTAAIDERTRLVALSWVEFSTGYRNDLKAIAAACHAKGALFCVDAIQALGALPLDVRDTDIDILATSSHKWLLAPTGVGWMYVRKALIERIGVSYLGQSSVSRSLALDYLDLDLPLWPDARRFEPGILNYQGLVGLTAAIALFNEVGMARVRDQIRRLSDRAVSGLLARGYTVISSRAGEEWSGAVSFQSPRLPAPAIHAALAAAHVVISLRNDIVRISPHYYNNDDDIAQFLDALPQ
ncbi:aminotransferase class V-fold PLP-dependent enzyme [Chelatococcus asaccharovorans]|uniref:Selenocysteine lyase/cysteine desulfurase n=1 Tax=Chelatococcus asaccharovorans TaxID=28210 RepID=A0A2V3U1K7_9HYPH|nr:aminotransferase class V-fold PLP-dependent enzyme [Chelatococcus asaccharovorans]MBS7707726.1 aminotransferase class V-fold PLP-dependent enzyme [Chelatococcus asaccharovorans]PXW55303.1 selenocysteine lyase/cysteine desulfurase [Chelatococcus asaccharovorans]